MIENINFFVLANYIEREQQKQTSVKNDDVGIGRRGLASQNEFIVITEVGRE